MGDDVRMPVNLNGQLQLMTPVEIELAKREINITGMINEESASKVNSALRCLADESKDDITLHIQSIGGSPSAALSIFDTAKTTKCDIVTVACGIVASEAAFILAAVGTKGKRWCQPNAEVQIYQMRGGAMRQAANIRIQAEHKINRILSECTGKSQEQIENDTERYSSMSAEEALEYGLVDIVGDPYGDSCRGLNDRQAEKAMLDYLADPTPARSASFIAKKIEMPHEDFPSDPELDEIIARIDAQIAAMKAEEQSKKEKENAKKKYVVTIKWFNCRKHILAQLISTCNQEEVRHISKKLDHLPYSIEFNKKKNLNKFMRSVQEMDLDVEMEN